MGEHSRHGDGTEGDDFHPQYKLLFEKNADGIVVVDEAGAILFVNPAAEKIFGRSANQLLREPIGIPLSTTAAEEITLLQPGGNKIEAEMRIVATAWAGRPALLLSLRDIATRRMAEARVRQSQKLEALGQLTAGVAHDFNNVLTAVIGNLELILLKSRDETTRKYASHGLQGARRGAQLTAQLLAFSRNQELDLRTVSLNKIVDGANDLLIRATSDRAARIIRILDSDLWLTLADSTQIEMVLLNLVINACDAMPNGGTIRIETRNVAASDPSRPAELVAGDAVAVIVSDSGVGMSDEVKARAFDPFFTTKDVGRGSGLGLSMAYGVALQLGGSLQLTSKLGRGTSVGVYLPRSTKVVDATVSE